MARESPGETILSLGILTTSGFAKLTCASEITIYIVHVRSAAQVSMPC